ncbi:MAG: hypothetical protein AB8B64_02505 [Granulosicoccus sp.]
MTGKYAKLPVWRFAGACTLAVVMLPANVTQTHAAFYKCIAADGSITYNDMPCAADESTHLLSKSARELPGLDCRIAHNFAVDAVARMRQKDKAADVLEAYGGAHALSQGARSLINYVFSYRDNRFVSAQRIVDTTIKRCRAGRLGKTLDQCDEFPKEFIKRFGGCLKARQSDQTVLIQPQASGQLSSNSVRNGANAAPPALNAAMPLTTKTQDDDAMPDSDVTVGSADVDSDVPEN